jgi:hypothetical protein
MRKTVLQIKTPRKISENSHQRKNPWKKNPSANKRPQNGSKISFMHNFAHGLKTVFFASVSIRTSTPELFIGLWIERLIDSLCYKQFLMRAFDREPLTGSFSAFYHYFFTVQKDLKCLKLAYTNSEILLCFNLRRFFLILSGKSRERGSFSLTSNRRRKTFRDFLSGRLFTHFTLKWEGRSRFRRRNA